MDIYKEKYKMTIRDWLSVDLRTPWLVVYLSCKENLPKFIPVKTSIFARIKIDFNYGHPEKYLGQYFMYKLYIYSFLQVKDLSSGSIYELMERLERLSIQSLQERIKTLESDIQGIERGPFNESKFSDYFVAKVKRGHQQVQPLSLYSLKCIFHALCLLLM